MKPVLPALATLLLASAHVHASSTDADLGGLASSGRAQLAALAATLRSRPERISSIHLNPTGNASTTATQAATWLIAQGVPARLVSVDAPMRVALACTRAASPAEPSGCAPSTRRIEVTVTY